MATSTIKLDDSGWLSISSGIGSYRKRNGMVTVSLDSSINLTSSWQSIGTLPDEYCPSFTVYQESICINSGSQRASIAINSTGIISARLNTGASSQGVVVGAVITYPV